MIYEPKMSFEEIKGIQAYHEAKDYHMVSDKKTGYEYVACRHVDIRKYLTTEQLCAIAQSYIDLFGKIQYEQIIHAKGCLR